MNINIKCFIIPHNEEPYYTCADRYAVDLNTKSIAIADGVGGSLYPSFLSERITKDFVTNPVDFFDETSHSLNKDYSLEFETYYQQRYKELSPGKQQILDLKVEQTKASSCTFVGCRVINNFLKYYALGDSYLFYITNDGAMSKFSSMEGKEFDVFPEYFSTNGKHNGKIKIGEIPLQNGVLLMMTDALSDWFIKYFEEDKSLLDRILSLSNHKEYKDFCNNELASARLHDDDCALIVATIENVANPEITFSIKHMDNISDLSERELQGLIQIKDSEMKNVIFQRDKLSEERDNIQTDLINVRQTLENEKQSHQKLIDEKERMIQELQEKINSPIVPPSTIELSEIRKFGEILQKIETKIDKNMKEDTTWEKIQQVLKEVKDGIESLLQYVNNKEENNSTSIATPSENSCESKKKLKIVFKNINLLLNSIIIILLILIFIFK